MALHPLGDAGHKILIFARNVYTTCRRRQGTTFGVIYQLKFGILTLRSIDWYTNESILKGGGGSGNVRGGPGGGSSHNFLAARVNLDKNHIFGILASRAIN